MTRPSVLFSAAITALTAITALSAITTLSGCDDSVKVTIKVKTADAGAAGAILTGTAKTSTMAAGMACCQAETATKAVP